MMKNSPSRLGRVRSWYVKTKKITNRGSIKVIGKFPSLKMNSIVMWESQLERDYIYLLEIDSDVVAYKSQPFTIAYNSQYKRRKYTPDFLVERTNLKQIVEIKQERKIEKFSQSDRYRQAANFCLTHDLDFVVVTEKIIRVQPRLDNIKLLHRYARVVLPWYVYTECFNYFHSVVGSTILEAEARLKAKGISYSCLLKLLWNGFLLTDLMRPITAQSLVQLSPLSVANRIGIGV